MSNSTELTRLTHVPRQSQELQHNNSNKNTLSPIKHHTLKQSNSTHMIDTVCYQPQMRFKPRTDLERVYESVNLNFFERADKDVIKRQLKNINLYSSKKTFDSNSFTKNTVAAINEDKKNNLDFPDYLIRNFKTPPNKVDLYKGNNSPNVKILYRKPINNESKKLISDFHHKTHFKGLESILLLPNQIDMTKLGEPSKCLSPVIKPKKLNLSKDNENVMFDIHEEDKLLKRIEEKRNESLMKHKTFYISRNPVKLRKHGHDNAFLQNDNYDKLNTLKKIAFENEYVHVPPDKDKNASSKKEEQIDEFKREEYKLLIGKEVFYTHNQLDLIANTLLNKCNIYHKKNKNNKNQLKMGEGKLMMTGGLTLNQFMNKYNFE